MERALRILMCSPHTLTPRLGASKVYIEAAQAFRQLGWHVTLVGPEERTAWSSPAIPPSEYELLRNYLREHAADYDVVEYEHNRLPYPRSDFPTEPLFVARSVLLSHQVAASRIPPLPTLRGMLSHWLKGRRSRAQLQRQVLLADRTMRSADLINLSNTHDRDLLVRSGYPGGKMMVAPFGLFPERLAQFTPNPDALPANPVVAFVGTFDPRKGLVDFPRIVRRVLDRHPAARFRLLGTAGLIPTVKGVLRFFPSAARSRVEVVPAYQPDELPGLLRECSIGVFPSRCEGFGFGVLEMLAAGLPVVAFDAPGPPMMLTPDNLVPVGDADALARRLCVLLGDPEGLREARRAARCRAEELGWAAAAAHTAAAYAAARAERQRNFSPPPSLEVVGVAKAARAVSE